MRNEALLRSICELIADLTGVDQSQIGSATNFNKDLCCDDMESVEIAMAIESEFGIRIPDDSAADLVTVGHLVDFVEARLDR